MTVFNRSLFFIGETNKMSKKQTYFRNDWLSNPEFKNWLKCKDSKAAFCVKCNKSIELSNMGEQDLRSHMEPEKHLKGMEPINVFFQPRRQPVITTTTAINSRTFGKHSTCLSKTVNIGSEFIIC